VSGQRLAASGIHAHLGDLANQRHSGGWVDAPDDRDRDQAPRRAIGFFVTLREEVKDPQTGRIVQQRSANIIRRIRPRSSSS
jgi:hypothetical protein